MIDDKNLVLGKSIILENQKKDINENEEDKTIENIKQIQENQNNNFNSSENNNNIKYSTPIKMNTNKNETNYENLFRSYTASPVKSKRSSLTVDDLTKDNTLIKKSTIAQKDEYIKIEDWDYDLAALEEGFKRVDSKSKIKYKIMFYNF